MPVLKGFRTLLDAYKRMLIYGDTLESQGFSFFTEVKISTTNMIYCETYELLSFFDSMLLEDDLVIEASKINRLANLLWEDNIKCRFNEEDFELAAYEYPKLLEVRSAEIIIKKRVESRRSFVYYNSNIETIQHIREKWEQIVKEF